MKSLNKKIIQTKQALRQALWMLIETKDLQEITVSEICRAANINRTTFYKYYSLPMDVLREFIEEICEQVIQRIRERNDMNTENDIYEVILDICRIYFEHKLIMKVYLDFNKPLMQIMLKLFGGDLKNRLEENSLNLNFESA